MKYPLLQIIMGSKAVLIIVSLVIMLISVVSFGTSCAPGASRSQEASWELSTFKLSSSPDFQEPVHTFFTDRENRITVSLPASPTINIEQGKTLYVKAQIKNIGATDGDYEWNILLDGERIYPVTPATVHVSSHCINDVGTNHGTVDLQNWYFSYQTPDSIDNLGVHEVKIGTVTLHFTIYSHFPAEISDLLIHPTTEGSRPVHPGEKLFTNYRVHNPGTLVEEYNLNLVVDGNVVNSMSYQVLAGETLYRFFSLETDGYTAGTHKVIIYADNSLSYVYGEFQVIAETAASVSGLTAGSSSPSTSTPATGTPDTSVPSTPATPVTPTTPGAVTTPTTIPTTPTTPPSTIDFSKWFSEAYATMSDEDYYLPVWNISDDNKSVTENTNCQPSLFYSDFLTMNTRIHVKIKPLSKPGDDDDYIGFVLGFQPGDTKNKQADYLLIDWKNSIPGESLNKDFNSPGSGGSAKVGLAVSRVTGIPTSDEFWQHIDDPQGSPQGEGLTELAPRSVNFGNTGWVFDKEYDFSFEFSQTTLKIYVDGTLEMQISGNFKDGRLAFYNFSQEGVTYKVTQ
jgi:hypothetical protein